MKLSINLFCPKLNYTDQHDQSRKAFLVSQMERLRKIYAFNRYERDQWVAEQSVHIQPGSRVLDVGAGSCPYRHLFSHCDYRTHDFVQLSPDQLFGRTGYGDIDYVSNITSIPVPDASFDAILCTEVLEHVPEPIEVIHELARILKPNGKLLLTAPLGSGLHQEPYHFYGGYTPYWYQKFLPQFGFKKITVEPNGGFFKFYGQESLRFALLLAPNDRKKIKWLLLWLLILPWFAIICPLLAHFLDQLDTEKSFTVGYHVTAIRGS